VDDAKVTDNPICPNVFFGQKIGMLVNNTGKQGQRLVQTHRKYDFGPCAISKSLDEPLKQVAAP
jgi:hypothetical protein